LATAASLLAVDGREDARRAAIMRRAAVALREGVLAAVERRAADLRAVLLRAAVLRAVVLRAGRLRAAAFFPTGFNTVGRGGGQESAREGKLWWCALHIKK